MRVKMLLVNLFAVLFVMLLTPVFAAAETTCSLSTSSVEIMVGQEIKWTVASSPQGQKYFWHVNGKNGVAGAGASLTPWTGPYKYDSPAYYNVYFTVHDTGGNTTCTSNEVNITVNPIFVAGTNFFPWGGVFVEDQYIDLQIFSNVASGVTLHWAIVVIDNKLIGSISEPITPLIQPWGMPEGLRGVGHHEVMVIMETSAGRFADYADFEILSKESAVPQQKPSTVCIPLPGLPSGCRNVPLPPTPPPSVPTVPTSTSTFPPGCTSNQGFSSTTGGSCSQ